MCVLVSVSRCILHAKCLQDHGLNDHHDERQMQEEEEAEETEERSRDVHQAHKLLIDWQKNASFGRIDHLKPVGLSSQSTKVMIESSRRKSRRRRRWDWVACHNIATEAIERKHLQRVPKTKFDHHRPMVVGRRCEVKLQTIVVARDLDGKRGYLKSLLDTKRT